MVFIWSYMTSTMADPTVRSTLALAPLNRAALPEVRCVDTETAGLGEEGVRRKT